MATAQAIAAGQQTSVAAALAFVGPGGHIPCVTFVAVHVTQKEYDDDPARKYVGGLNAKYSNSDPTVGLLRLSLGVMAIKPLQPPSCGQPREPEASNCADRTSHALEHGQPTDPLSLSDELSPMPDDR